MLKQTEKINKKPARSHRLQKKSNNNGVRLINYVISKGMVIGNTRLSKKEVYSHIWISPDGKFNSQIYHIVVDRIHKLTIKNVRRYRGVQIIT